MAICSVYFRITPRQFCPAVINDYLQQDVYSMASNFLTYCMAFRHEHSLTSVTLTHSYGAMTAIINYNF